MDLSETSSSVYLLWQENISSTIKFMNNTNEDYYTLCNNLHVNTRRILELINELYLNWYSSVEKNFPKYAPFSSGSSKVTDTNK